ncbi:MAG: hypothetical protein FJ044_04485 [Candidatus Cloacimonetes bacterium]|nr:hypothetical protein [Candidatus Cloacimonadota bacterium]
MSAEQIGYIPSEQKRGEGPLGAVEKTKVLRPQRGPRRSTYPRSGYEAQRGAAFSRYARDARRAEESVIRLEKQYQIFRHEVEGQSPILMVRDQKRIGVIPENLREQVETGETNVEKIKDQISWYDRAAAEEGRAVPLPAAA